MGTQLAGKTAIITGSTSGIGRATALLFAEEGANVVVVGRRQSRGEQVVGEIEQAGGSAIYVKTDVCVIDDLRTMVRAAVDAFGGLDILVNNAISFTEGSMGSVLDVTVEGWETVVLSSLSAIIFGSKFAIPHMIDAGGGAIVNMSSVHGLTAGFGLTSYNAVKGGILNLTRQMAMEFGKQNIRVNAICPGLIMTEKETRYQNDPSERPEFKYKKLTTPAMYPLGRGGKPREVAQACLFLASEASSFVTGAALPVDGGLLIQEPEQLAIPLGEVFRQHFAAEWGVEPDADIVARDEEQGATG